MKDSDGHTEELKELELALFYQIEHPKSNEQDFKDLIEKLDSGKIVNIGNGVEIMKPGVFNNPYRNIQNTSNKQIEIGGVIIPPLPKDVCRHPRKYKNHCQTFSFWVCPDCKADLGDV